MNQSVASRRRRAVLAGGLVLGLGAAVTLAAWNDSEFASGTFTAGSFNLQGSTDGSVFGDNNNAASPASLVFQVNPTNLAPDDVVYAPFAVRLAAGTTHDAEVTLSHEASTGTITNLTYGVVEVDAVAECAAGVEAAEDPLVAFGTALGTVPAGATFGLENGPDAATAGDAQVLCFVVTAGDAQVLCFVVTAGTIAQAQSGSVTWELAAESQA